MYNNQEKIITCLANVGFYYDLNLNIDNRSLKFSYNNAYNVIKKENYNVIKKM